MRPIPILATALASLLVCFGSASAPAKGLTPERQLEQQVGSDLLSAKPSALEKAVSACVKQNRKDCHRFAPAALASGRADANAIAPYLVAASIEALGKELTEKELADIIFASVKVTPDAVLEIVDASARIVPATMVQTIVTAATNAVPDPYKMVKLAQKKSDLETVRDLSGANGDFKNVASFKGDYKSDYKGPEPEGEPETLAQAIVDTAALASGVRDLSNPGSNLSLMGAVVTDPIGTAGDPNYGNEPRVKAATIPVVSK